jgi:hypothetical protein
VALDGAVREAERMIDSEALLTQLCGPSELATFKHVHRMSMRLARVVKEVIAEELHGELPSKGKQFLETPRGRWRLATRANSDNTTEEQAHRQMGAHLVQVFGEINSQRTSRGWMSVEDLYSAHGVQFDASRLVRKVEARLQ